MDAQAYYEMESEFYARYDYTYECGAEARLLSAEPWDEDEYPAGCPFPEPEPEYPSCPVDLGYDIEDIPF